MANRKRATSEAQDQAASQRPDLISGMVPPPPPPAETPSPPATVVKLDQFTTLVQQVQALAQLVQGLQATPGLAVPTPQLHEEVVAPAPPVISSSNPPEAVDYHRRPAKAKPAPQQAEAKSPPRSRWVRSLSPVSSQSSTPLPPSHYSIPPATLDEGIRRQMQEMRQEWRRELDAAKQAPPSQPKAEQGIPFSERIMREVIPPHVKLPTIKPYHGSTDPDDHLSSFRSIMMFHGASDAILCRAFPSTLRGYARTWFNSLKPGFIYSFDEMNCLLISQFVSSHRQRRRSDSLSEVKQREGESLKSYLGRFNTALLEVDHLNHEVAMSALAGGVSKEGEFYLALEVNYPKSLSDMMSLADKYARVEESRRSAQAEQMKRKEAKGSDKQRAHRRISPPRHHRAPPPPPRDRTRSPARRFNRYTPLTAPRMQILMEIERQLP